MKFCSHFFCNILRSLNIELIMCWYTELYNSKQTTLYYPIEEINCCYLEDSTTSTLSFCYHRGSLSSVSLPSSLVKLGLYLNTFLQKACNSFSVAELFIYGLFYATFITNFCFHISILLILYKVRIIY